MYGCINIPLVYRIGYPSAMHRAAQASLARVRHTIALGVSERDGSISFGRMPYQCQPGYCLTLLEKNTSGSQSGPKDGLESHDLRVAWQGDMFY